MNALINLFVIASLQMWSWCGSSPDAVDSSTISKTRNESTFVKCFHQSHARLTGLYCIFLSLRRALSGLVAMHMKVVFSIWVDLHRQSKSVDFRVWGWLDLESAVCGYLCTLYLMWWLSDCTVVVVYWHMVKDGRLSCYTLPFLSTARINILVVWQFCFHPDCV